MMMTPMQTALRSPFEQESKSISSVESKKETKVSKLFSGPVITVPVFKFSKKVKYETIKKPVQKTTVDIATGSESKDTFRLDEKDIEDIAHELNQSGYRSLKTFETRIIGQDPKFADVGISNTFVKKVEISSERINQLKNTYRAGYQGQAEKDISTDKKFMLMGVKEPEKIKNTGIYGDDHNANGHNGYARNSLYVATYIDSQGIGKR